MKYTIVFLLSFMVSCAFFQNIDEATYARFTAQKMLLEETYSNAPDSLNLYLKGLYKKEELTPEALEKYRKKLENDPEEYIAVQEAIMTELYKLDPALAKRPSPKAAPKPIKR